MEKVLDETVTTIRFRGNHKQSVLAGEALFQSEIVKLIHVFPEYLKESWQLYQKYADKEFSFTDATTLAVMKDLGTPRIFAFDREFQQAGLQLIGP